MLTLRSCAMRAHEPCQVGNEAALRGVFHVTQGTRRRVRTWSADFFYDFRQVRELGRRQLEKTKKIRHGRLIFTLLFTIFAAGNSVFCEGFGSQIGGFFLGSSTLIMTGAFCGNLPGIVAVLISLIVRVIIDPTKLYIVGLHMIAVLLADLAARHRIYRSLLKTTVCAAIIAAIIGALGSFVWAIIMVGEISGDIIKSILWDYVYALPECLGTLILVYAVFRFLPDRAKVYIPNGIYYIDDGSPVYKEAGGLEEQRKKETSRLSFRITRVIMIEAFLLIISASAFAIHLVSLLNIDTSALLQSDMGNPAYDMGGDFSPSDNHAPDGEPPEKPPGDDIPPEKPNGTDEPPEMKPVFGERTVDAVSRNGIFNDEKSPLGRERRMNRKTAVAFAVRLSMILFTIGVIIAILANAYMQFSVARPIRKMSETMNGFAFSGNDGVIRGSEELSGIRIHSRDEIEELYHALVKTVADTEEYLERLREEDKMKNELEVARAASSAKSAFLSSMSHEIRTPINAILGFDEMILMENKDPEIGKYARDIQSAGKTLLALINDILDFSKIEAGKMDIVPVQYELTSTINDVVSMTMSLANDKGLSFNVHVDPKIPHLLFGDEIRIKQCITNILSNAVKYTEEGGCTLDIGYEKADEDAIMLNVSVKDTGIGIKEEDMEKLFSAFDRLDQVRNKAVKGTGLGMSITKQLLENMDSHLEVESEYEKGSNFHFSVRQQVIKWEEIGDLTEAFKRYIPTSEPGNKNDTFFAPKARILVTDDTENNLLVVTRLLKRTGIQIDTADSGKRTLELVKENRYDIIYLDHMMPEMDGIETLHRMEELPGNMNTGVPVIVLTANAVSGSREMYMAEGFTDYMTKPVSYLTLKKSLTEYLPEDKIEEKTAEDTKDAEAGDDTGTAVSVLDGVSGINVEEGIRYSGDPETLVDVIKGFRSRIEDSAGEIERELSGLDIRNYTVHVHALKSSSRLIGAEELSELALEMENTGNAYQKAIAAGDMDSASGALSKMENRTPVLLSLYRSYVEKLAAAEGDGKKEQKEDLPLIPEEELKEMLLGIREFAEAFDMDSVDSTIGMMEAYAIPEDKKALTEELKKAVRNVDRDAILEILKKI